MTHEQRQAQRRAQQLLRILGHEHGVAPVLMSLADFLPGEKVAEFFKFVEERYAEPCAEDWEAQLDSLAEGV